MVAVTSSGLASKSISVPSWPGTQVVGRRELHRGLRLAQRRTHLGHRAFVARAGPVRGVDRRTGVATVATELPHEEHHEAHEQQQHRAGQPAGGRRDAEGGGEAEPLFEDPLRRGDHRALGKLDGERHPLVRGQLLHREHRVGPGGRGGRARERGPGRPRCAADPLDVGRRVHHRARSLDRHRPVEAHRVPHQLVVVGEGVERAAYPVGDVVGVRAGDGAVGVADLDALVAAVVLDGVLRRRCRPRP